MRKVLANIIGLAIVALLVVGFKSYVIYYYEPVENTIHIGSKVNIEYDKSKSNHNNFKNRNYSREKEQKEPKKRDYKEERRRLRERSRSNSVLKMMKVSTFII